LRAPGDEAAEHREITTRSAEDRIHRRMISSFSGFLRISAEIVLAVTPDASRRPREKQIIRGEAEFADG
jgi:hypothetical protein